MTRRIFCVLFAVMMLTMVGLSASAAGTGSISVDLGGEGTVTLYKVGEFINGGFLLGEAYGGGVITDMDSLSAELAVWLAQKADKGTTKQAENGMCKFPDLSEGLYLVVQTEATVGQYSFQPFLASVPWDGNIWDIEAKPKLQAVPTATPKTGDESTVFFALFGMTLSLGGMAVCLMQKRADFKKRY